MRFIIQRRRKRQGKRTEEGGMSNIKYNYKCITWNLRKPLQIKIKGKLCLLLFILHFSCINLPNVKADIISLPKMY